MNNKFYILICIVLFQVSFVKAQWGELDSRTEYRNDAGLSGSEGAKSGFYQTLAPVNFPAGAQGWWHLLDVRHSNLSNNYAMQFSGNFYDQILYFRKTNGNPGQQWSQVLTANSDGKLINSNINITTAAGQSFFTGHQTGTTYSYPLGIFHAVTDNDNGTLNFLYDGITAGLTKFYVRADGEGYFSGNVGIGIENPKEKLAVKGIIHSQEVLVDMKGWSDDVFQKDYNLVPLANVKTYINQNHHLPGVPSEKEIIEKGLQLGEMNKILMKKVEELTLYLIEKDIQVDKEKHRNDAQQEQIDLLTTQLTQLKKSGKRL
ncbi:hypothetical protein SAMN06265348_103298 [Pedobacter westerhofensis]|uniref:Uncharacterized protein n=1 Tax=Pedobacter westerhofensis TaxID=425512 RepID=A0A521C9Q0_9SPHI|nr:hypothetical protein [Pedobacter westerhofensis]SMO55551.1 hypothetical protein SAMN06265348_103298 [Pedobacter westerhofensis]